MRFFRGPRARPARGWSVRFLLLVLWLTPAGLGRTAGSSVTAATPFRVMTYNTHHGEGTDGRVDLARIADLIRQQRADIVALQEVDQGVTRTQRRDLPAELAQLTGMACVFTNNIHYQGGLYGNALLTQFPILSWTNTHLRMLRPGEQRGVLQVILELPPYSPGAAAQRLLVMNTHIDYRPDDAERLQNVAEFKEILGRYPGLPLVFCGDFNDTPGSRTHRAMAETFVDAWTVAGQGDGFTIPSTGPTKRIDYLWIRPESILTPIRAVTVPSLASDHLPVVVEFDRRPQPNPPKN